jgi:ribosomal protein L11 methylase PrmA
MIRSRGIDLDEVSLEELGLSSERSIAHASSAGPELEVVFRALCIRQGDAIIDFGSGKGGAIITMARFPFSKIAGVEISPELVQIAKTNLSRLGIERTEIFCSDASAFTELDEYTHVYFYHPFPCNVMEPVIKNIEASLTRRPRNMTIIYRNPVCHRAVIAGSLFKQVREIGPSGSKQVVVYTSEPLP